MTPLLSRLDWAWRHLKPQPTDARIVWDDPDSLDEPVKVTGPAPEFMAALFHGGIVPSIEAWLAYADAYAARDLTAITAAHRAVHFTDPIGPLSEPEALAYVMTKDVPMRVWHRNANRPLWQIVDRSELPAARIERNFWRLDPDTGRVSVDEFLSYWGPPAI